jgi:SPP1 gp7 family putative phage head morphogenesis protein
MPHHQLAAKYRNDPTQAKKISDRIENKLVGLFEQAKKDLEKILPEDKALEYRTNAIPAERLPQYFKKVDETFQYVNERGAEVFGRKLKDGTTVGEIPKAWQQGQVYASIQLGAPYEVRKVAWEQIGTRIIEGQSDLKKLTDENAGRVRQIIADGIIKERKFGDITRDIVRETDKVGINRAIMIARTETMRAVNDGVLDRYKKSDVQYVKWLAAGDERTCPDCKDLDGKVFPIDEVPPCPKHPGCRCTWTPVVRMPGE